MTVERDEIPMYTIEFAFYLPNEIGYVKIKKFSETTGEELNDALNRLDESRLRALILDLRDNPGGALNQAIQVADRFSLQGDNWWCGRKCEKEEATSMSRPRGGDHVYPMVVLIDRNSASASEIVAGALQDHDRALIVGETSFGKALVQTIYPLDQSRGLALTTGRYYTPSDRLIQRKLHREFFTGIFREGAKILRQNGLEHKTGSGRPVYGGGGITPDEEVSPAGSSQDRASTGAQGRFPASSWTSCPKGGARSQVPFPQPVGTLEQPLGGGAGRASAKAPGDRKASRPFPAVSRRREGLLQSRRFRCQQPS